MIELDLRSRKPIYEQLMEKIKEAIMMGTFKADEQLPSVRVLSAQLVVNPNTIQKAYRELEREGYIYSLPGKGSFIAPVRQQFDESKLNELRKELQRLLTEAIFYGFTQEDIAALFEEAKQKERRGPNP